VRAFHATTSVTETTTASTVQTKPTAVN